MYIASDRLKATRVGLDASFQQAYQSVAQADLWYQQVASEKRQTGSGTLYHLSGLLPRLREWVGARRLNNLVQKDYLLEDRPYEGSFSLLLKDIEDDNLGSYNDAIQGLGRSARLWPNDLVLEALLAGGAAECYDGQYFFDTDHPLEVQGQTPTTQANLHTTCALTAANFGLVRNAMLTRKGEDGKVIGVRPNLLVIPQALEIAAKQILQADLAGYLMNVSSTASDSNLYKGLAGMLILPDLDASSTTTWYLADTSKPVKPLIFQLRRAPSRIDVLDRPTDQAVFERGEVIVGCDGRGAAGYALWQLMDKCTA